jgi:16S rRNA (uracil1498-N3)-methyltransferase
LALPFFYKQDISFSTTAITLDEDTSKHIIQVLRMKMGEQLQLTNGLGNLFTCEIKNDNRKKCEVVVIERENFPASKKQITIAISLVKNVARLEWFLEKATEIGVAEIVLLLCERTEKQQVKMDRWNGILISAMLQSQQVWLPTMVQPKKLVEFVKNVPTQNKFIAHCETEDKTSIKNFFLTPQALNASTICIGPEGDFTKKEIELAIQNNFMPVSLGNTRLRTETAGIVAATWLCG